MAEIAIPFVIFLVGLALGSFANVVIYRMDNLHSILSVPSHCPHCHHRLAWHDLVPVLSFLQLRGRCRYCGKPISRQYPLVELSLGLLAVLLFSWFGLSVTFLVHLLTALALVILFSFDLRYMLLPDRIVIPGIVLGMVSYFWRHGLSTPTLVHLLLGIFVAAGFLGALFLVGRGRWIGFGDVKYGILMGGFLGYPQVLAGLLIAFFTGSLVAGALVLLGKRGMKSEIPFGPFLVMGTFVALFWGETLTTWYERAFR